ncbi:MAG: DUF2283 domain-containing protein [Pseudonocardiaceae bacterium]
MANNAVVSVRLDRDAGAAYLRLSTKSVASAVEFSKDVYVDLDETGDVVGVELPDLMIHIPMDDLASKTTSRNYSPPCSQHSEPNGGCVRVVACHSEPNGGCGGVEGVRHERTDARTNPER